MKAPVFYKIIPTSGIGGRGVNLKAIPGKSGQEVSQGGKRGLKRKGRLRAAPRGGTAGAW